MSKKKARMTLKDFHGGSIPSDLPLPSAPGLTVRPMDRTTIDRPNPWGTSKLRTGSVKSNFDDKTPFLSSNTFIGRNFDEDERKPLDGGFGPRRAVNNDTIHSFPTRAEVAKPNNPTTSRPTPGQQLSSASPSSYAGRVSEVPYGGAVPKYGGNVWTTRAAEVASVADVTKPVTWSGPDAASKLANASALDKVSSGRWLSNKQPVHHFENVEPISHSEIETSYRSVDAVGHVEHQDVVLVKHLEKNLTIDDGNVVRSTKYPDKFDNKFQIYGGQIGHSDVYVGLAIPSVAPLQQSERPKLKLLPRSKPLESSEAPIEQNQGYRQPQNHDDLHKINEPYETGYYGKPVLIASDSEDMTVDRPKLNLKPRSQASEQVEVENTRKTVFGGARPRELVLKERGVDDIVVNNYDVVQPPNRGKQDIPRTKPISPHSTPTRYNGKAEAIPLDNKIRKSNDKRDNRVDPERTDVQKRNWRSEKHQPPHQPPQERPPSPDTWRKPVEEPRTVSSDGLRYGKAASAVELAQAFSKSISDPKMVDGFPSQKGIPRPGQIPFSRLTDPTSRAQVNGYS